MSRRVTRRCDRPTRGNERPHEPLEPEFSCQFKWWRTFEAGPVVEGPSTRTPGSRDSARDRPTKPEAPSGAMRRRGRPSGQAEESVRRQSVDRVSRGSRPSSASRHGCDRTQERPRLRWDSQRRSGRSDSSTTFRRRLASNPPPPVAFASRRSPAPVQVAIESQLLRQAGDAVGAASVPSVSATFEVLRKSTDQAQPGEHATESPGQASHIVSAQNFMQGRQPLRQPTRQEERRLARPEAPILIGNRCVGLHGRGLVEGLHGANRLRSCAPEHRRKSRRKLAHRRSRFESVAEVAVVSREEQWKV